MRLPVNFQASLQDARERQFDRDSAAHLAARYPTFAAHDEQVRLDWVTDRRRWPGRIGVTAQQHILDHLEIMARPFRSQEEKAVRLRRHFLTLDTAEVAHG